MKTPLVRNAVIGLIAGLGLMTTAVYADMQNKGMMGDQKGV